MSRKQLTAARCRLLLWTIAAALTALTALTAPLAGAGAVDVTFRVGVPPDTPAGDDVYIAGDFQGWNPGSPQHRLSEVEDLVHEITLSFAVGTTIQFKFTRGDWGRVEKGPNGEEIPNRVLQISEAGVREFTVATWADGGGGSTITGDVSLIDVPGFLNGRRVWVYLPPGYHDDVGERYPVLYMLDGQNVFDEATSFAGEWEVDESCERLIGNQEIRPIIVVAVANGELNRTHEYTPWFDVDRNAGGGGEDHLQAFIDVLIPFINAEYRTLDAPEHTGLAGSSLGGLMAAYAAYAHPEVFGRIAAVSPSILWADHELLRYVAAHSRPESFIYADMGTIEWGSTQDDDGNGVDDSIDDLRALQEVLLAQGFAMDEDLVVVEDEGGQHNEAFWAARFPVALRFLFPPGPVPVRTISLGELKSRFRKR